MLVGYLVVALSLLAVTAYASSIVVTLKPGDHFVTACPYPVANTAYNGQVSGDCPTPTPVPTVTATPQPLVWMRPQMTMLAESVGYTGVADCQYNQFGCGTEPLFAWQGVAPATCSYIAHGNDDDHVWITGQFPAPTVISGVRITTWGARAAPLDAITFEFRATGDTSPDDDAHVWTPPVAPFVTLAGQVPYLTAYRLTGMVSPPVTTQYVRFEAHGVPDWVTGGDLEFLVPLGTVGQASCT